MGSGHDLFLAKGRELWDELLTRDYEKGCLSILILAPKGQGKSTLLATIALKALELGDLVVWRGRHRDFWPRLPRELVKIFVHKNDSLKVLKILPGTKHATDITDELDIEHYRSIEELDEKLEEGKINVIYEPSWHQPSAGLRKTIKQDKEWTQGRFWWFDFLDFLAHRVDGRFLSLFIDEIDDIAPSGASGALWRALESLQHSLSELREKLVWIYSTTHDPAHLDPRILRKIDGFIYLRGAIVPRRLSTMPKKNAPAKLDLGEGIIEIRGRGYGFFTFQKLTHDGFLYSIQKVWQGPNITREEAKTGKETIKDELSKIAQEEGTESALLKLRKLYSSGQIGRSYYYELRKMLFGGDKNGGNSRSIEA